MKILQKEFPINEERELLDRKLAYPYEYFKSFEEYEVPFDKIDKKDYYSRLTNGYPNEAEIERKNKLIDIFKIKISKKITELYSKTDVIL